jgi:hypothetical protein
MYYFSSNMGNIRAKQACQLNLLGGTPNCIAGFQKLPSKKKHCSAQLFSGLVAGSLKHCCPCDAVHVGKGRVIPVLH